MSETVKRKIELKDSNLVLEGTKAKREAWSKKIGEYLRNLAGEQAERKQINAIRQDFFLGNQSAYTNVIGLQKKEKKGHANAIFNYVGKTAIKLYYSLANNPPNIKIPGLPVQPKYFPIEGTRSQSLEEMLDFTFYQNRFFESSYPRAALNQIVKAGAAVKVYYDSDKKKIKIVQKENVDNIYFGWDGDNSISYSFTIDREHRTVDSVEKEFGIKILKSGFETEQFDKNTTAGSHTEGGEYGTREKTSTQAQIVPTGKNDLPKVWVTDYWDDKRNIILINDEVVQYVEHEYGFNPWIYIPNIAVSNRPWGLSDIDLLIDPQIEYNEVSNDTRDFIRSATNMKYVVRNMQDFDPESIKTGSGQVIFIQGDDSSFEALPQPVNTFPADQYLQRIKKSIHDLGIPEVTYGAGQSDSGRSKAIDYQSMVDTVDDKRRSWKLAFQEICDRIQILGYKYYPAEFWKNPENNKFEIRPIELDWTDLVPLTSAEKTTNIVNKFQSGLISLNTALGEAGYKNVEAEIEKLRQEERDPELAPLRHRVVALLPGVREAQMEVQQEMAGQAQEVNQPNEQTPPTLTAGENQGATKPMAQAGSSMNFSSAKGKIARDNQNRNEQ